MPIPRADLDTAIVPLPEGLRLIHGGAFCGAPVAASPDPLVSYVWAETTPDARLQLYTLSPVTVEMMTEEMLGQKSRFDLAASASPGDR